MQNEKTVTKNFDIICNVIFHWSYFIGYISMKFDIANDVEIFGDCLVILHTIPSYKNKSIFMLILCACNVDQF